MIVQIYETQSPEEARQLVEAGVDHVGVLVGIKGEYPRELSPEQAREILRAIPAAAKGVVMSLSANLEDIAEIVKRTKPDILHLATLPEFLPPESIRALKERFPGLKITMSIPVEGPESVEIAKSYEQVADYLLLDTKEKGDTQTGATGKTHDWGISKKIVEAVRIPVILAGGLSPANVVEAIRKVRPAGVDSKTKTDKEGSHRKDIGKVREFVRNAKSFAE